MVFDTNILIAYLRGEDIVITAIEESARQGRALLISAISIGEVLAFPGLTELDIVSIKKFLDRFIIINVDEQIAELAALVRRRYGIALADAIIVATALLRNVPLVTRDKRLKKIKELTILDI